MNKIKKKKVLLLGQLPPPWHGVSAINSWILESEVLNKHFTFYPINLATAESIANIGKQSFYKYFFFVKIVLHTLYKLIKVNPNICYITLTPTGVAFYKDSIVLLLLKLFRKTIVVHSHGKGITEWVTSKPKWVKNYYIHVLKNTHLIVLGKNLLDDTKIIYQQNPYILPNGIPAFNYKNIEKKNTNTFEILYLSNLMKYKGVLDLVESLKLLNGYGKDFKAHIIGDSGDVSIEFVKNLILTYKLQDKVEVLGPKYKIEKYKYLYQADVLTFPSYYEPFGLVILEAFQAGIPVISTNEGCIPEIIADGENGFVIEKRNPQSIADALVKLINNPTLKKEIGERNKFKFETKFKFEIFEEHLKDIFEKVIS